MTLPQHILVLKEPSPTGIGLKVDRDKYQRVRLVSLNKCGQPSVRTTNQQSYGNVKQQTKNSKPTAERRATLMQDQ